MGPAGPSCPRTGGRSRLSDGQEGGAEASESLLESEGTGAAPFLDTESSRLFPQAPGRQFSGEASAQRSP